VPEKDEAKSFIQGVIEDIKNTKELADPEKDEIVRMVQEAWDAEQG
jgi:hypothetical protein